MQKPVYILLVIICTCSQISAVENRQIGGRAIGLSNAFVSISDTWSTFHNQASLASFQSFSAGIYYESRFMIDELSLTAATFVLPAGSGNFGFSFYQFGQGNFKEHKIGLAYARRLSNRLSAALQIDYFLQRFPENTTNTGFPTFEIGLIYKTTEQLTLGAHVFNMINNGFETLTGKQKIPACYRAGGDYQLSEFVLISTEIEKNSKYPATIKTGLEFSPHRNLALRFGISGRPVKYTAGFSYNFRKISTDFAFSYHGNLGLTPSVSIQINLE